MALAEVGRFQEAQGILRRAINLAVKAGQIASVPEMRERLRLYAAGKPYREKLTPEPREGKG